ncbi:hypothetical protein EOL73_02980 [Candidatus Saccharibacteria bacterium]|jgi:hypothetical protein|nr:hypothetical protein [Candidatus Saccharibacteria bacterium]NCU40693.1 hypothetical protein [Candidatus Saccharibacteria bacterium]
MLGWGEGSAEASSACFKNEQAPFYTLRYAEPAIPFASQNFVGSNPIASYEKRQTQKSDDFHG